MRVQGPSGLWMEEEELKELCREADVSGVMGQVSKGALSSSCRLSPRDTTEPGGGDRRVRGGLLP